MCFIQYVARINPPTKNSVIGYSCGQKDSLAIKAALKNRKSLEFENSG